MRMFDRDRLLGRRALLHRSTSGAPPVPRIGPACRDHRLCVALCPERALVGFELEGRRGVALRVADCTGCGRCVEACPERAIALEARPEATAALLPLAAHEPRSCEHCLEPFVGPPGEDLCPACAKDLSLFDPLARPFPGAAGGRDGEAR